MSLFTHLALLRRHGWNIETDPALSSLVKIAKALGVSVADLFSADDVFKDVNSVDKTLMEKVSLIEGLDKKERSAFFVMLDAGEQEKTEG